MKAAFIEKLGPAHVIQYGDLPMLEMGPLEVLVKVTAVTVDQVDTLIRSGSFPTHPKFPFIIGRDMTGQVVETGQDVSRFQHLESLKRGLDLKLQSKSKDKDFRAA